MDNPLAGSDSDSDSGYTSSDSGSDAGNGGDQAGDDLLSSLMPVSRLGGDGSDSESSSDEEVPLTAAEIRQLRADASKSGGAVEAAAIDYTAELKGTGRVPIMVAISAQSGEASSGPAAMRIDWARITKADMEAFVGLYDGLVADGGQIIREASRTPAWLLQYSIRSCLRLLLDLAKADGGAGGDALVGTLTKLIEKADATAMGEDHLVRRKSEGEPVQQCFDHMTDAVQDLVKEVKGRLKGATLGPHSDEGVSTCERIEQLLAGFEQWLDAGADPKDIEKWGGLQQRLTWAPALQLRGKELHMPADASAAEGSSSKRAHQRKHISAHAFHHSVQHHRNQVAPRSHATRGWLLQHALETQLDRLAEVLSSVSIADSVAKAVRELRKAVDQDATLRLVQGAADTAAELVDAIHDFVIEFKSRSGRLAKSTALEQRDMSRVQAMVDEVSAWLQGSGAEEKEATSPWRPGHDSECQSTRGLTEPRCTAGRWNAVFATGARLWRLLDIFDADDVGALKTLALRGVQLDMLLDGGGETMLMAASERNAAACVDWMLDSGLDSSAVNADGSTAFHYACAFGSLHCIASLLKHDCAVSAKDHEGKTGQMLAETEPWRDILNQILNLAESQQWKELELLINDQTRVRSLEQLVEEEADKRRPNLEYHSLPPSRWLPHHVMHWLEDAFPWSSQYVGDLEQKQPPITGELLVTSDDQTLLRECSITNDAHRRELMEALKDQDLWGWE